jgi:hypothetical protein
MSQSYARARSAHLEESLKKRGSCFEGLSDLARWYSLTAAEAAGLALAVGLRLTSGEVQELRAAIRSTDEANALAAGKEPTPAETTIDAFLKEEAAVKAFARIHGDAAFSVEGAREAFVGVTALPPIKSYARKP